MIIDNDDVDLKKVLKWIKENKSPEDVFDVKDLESWARNNGFVERDEYGN